MPPLVVKEGGFVFPLCPSCWHGLEAVDAFTEPWVYHLLKVIDKANIAKSCNDQFPHSPDMVPKGRLGLSLCAGPQSPGLPQTEEMFMGVSWLILKLREVSSLSMGTIYSFHKRSSDQTYVNKYKQI